MHDNPTIEPAEARRLLDTGSITLIDVRDPDEHAAERIHGASLFPLARIDARTCANLRGQRVVAHCKGGTRSWQAVARLRTFGIEAASLSGGIEAWKRAGMPTVRAAGAPMPIMRQVQIVVGAGVSAGAALAWWVSPYFIVIPAVFGAGLLFAGLTGTCALASLLGVMPWNRYSATAHAAACPIR